MQHLDTIRFDKIGIVKVKDEYEGVKFYIGTGDGFNEQDDIKYIMNYGRPFHLPESYKKDLK